MGGRMGDGFRASVSFCRALSDGELANRALELSRLELPLNGLGSDPGNTVPAEVEAVEGDDRGGLNPLRLPGRGRAEREAAVFSWRISRGFLPGGGREEDEDGLLLAEARNPEKGDKSLSERCRYLRDSSECTGKDDDDDDNEDGADTGANSSPFSLYLESFSTASFPVLLCLLLSSSAEDGDCGLLLSLPASRLSWVTGEQLPESRPSPCPTASRVLEIKSGKLKPFGARSTGPEVPERAALAAAAAAAFCRPDMAAPTEASPSLDIMLRSMSAGRCLGSRPLAISCRRICWIIWI